MMVPPGLVQSISVTTDSVMQMGKQRFHVDAMDVGIKDTATQWRYCDLNIGVAALITPFDLKALSGDVSATELTVGSLVARAGEWPLQRSCLMSSPV
jgi:hypothetical protein